MSSATSFCFNPLFIRQAANFHFIIVSSNNKLYSLYLICKKWKILSKFSKNNILRGRERKEFTTLRYSDIWIYYIQLILAIVNYSVIE